MSNTVITYSFPKATSLGIGSVFLILLLCIENKQRMREFCVSGSVLDFSHEYIILFPIKTIEWAINTQQNMYTNLWKYFKTLNAFRTWNLQLPSFQKHLFVFLRAWMCVKNNIFAKKIKVYRVTVVNFVRFCTLLNWMAQSSVLKWGVMEQQQMK